MDSCYPLTPFRFEGFVLFGTIKQVKKQGHNATAVLFLAILSSYDING